MTLIGIGSAAEREALSSSTPLELLQGCHARIRHFVQLARTLASAVEAPVEEIAEAARALYRYFDEALPLHEADENESLFPRLQALPEGNLVREAATAMVEQHKAIEELVVELLRMCAILEHQPRRLVALSARLEEVTEALSKIFIAHLHMEESVIFPALNLIFTPAQTAEILREMQERRRPNAGSIHLVQ